MHAENKPSDSFITNNLINPIINFGKNLFFLISEALAHVAAIFSRLITGRRASNQLAQREPVLANFVNQMDILSDSSVSIRLDNPFLPPNILHAFNKSFFNTFKTSLNIVEENENDLLWEKHSLVIKKKLFFAYRTFL
jgi:hypothetical protein